MESGKYAIDLTPAKSYKKSFVSYDTDTNQSAIINS